MKRSLRMSIAVIAVGLVYLSTTGFQCSSPNVTSGKMYYQQYEASAPKDTNKLNMALEMFRKETVEKPSSAEAWYWVGFIHGMKKEYLPLVDAWSKSKSYGPQMAKEIDQNGKYFWGQAFNEGAKTFKKAQIKKDKALFGEAANSFRAATLLEPDTSARYGGFVNLAYALLAQDKTAEAMKALDEQNARVPNPEAFRLLASMHLDEANALKKNGKTDEAAKKYDAVITTLNQATLKFPENADLNQELLNAYVAANRLVEAKPKFKEYADKNTGDKMAQYALGTVLLETKEYEDAVTYLLRAISIDPKFDNALYNVCVAYLRWGIKVRDDEIKANPDKQVTAYKPIIERALPHLKALTANRPDALANWDLAGKVYAALGLNKDAEEAYKKADELRGK